jgi:hypothetical protein
MRPATFIRDVEQRSRLLEEEKSQPRSKVKPLVLSDNEDAVSASRFAYDNISHSNNGSAVKS